MKLRRWTLAVAVFALAVGGAMMMIPSVDAVPNAQPAPFIGACGYYPWVVLNDECSGGDYLGGQTYSSYSACQAALPALLQHAANMGCSGHGSCRPAKWCY